MCDRNLRKKSFGVKYIWRIGFKSPCFMWDTYCSTYSIQLKSFIPHSQGINSRRGYEGGIEGGRDRRRVGEIEG